MYRLPILLILASFGALAASNENLGERPDYIEALRSAGQVTYCGELAERWDDGTWSRAMGIADVILPGLPDGVNTWRRPEDMPRDGIHHGNWLTMNDNERAWYAGLFHDGWQVADAWIQAHPLELTAPEVHDWTGLIPYLTRMRLKQGRFEKCVREWKVEQKI
jgi:hypothetical protein